jgi:hypothetical protein
MFVSRSRVAQLWKQRTRQAKEFEAYPEKTAMIFPS